MNEDNKVTKSGKEYKEMEVSDKELEHIKTKILNFGKIE